MLYNWPDPTRATNCQIRVPLIRQSGYSYTQNQSGLALYTRFITPHIHNADMHFFTIILMEKTSCVHRITVSRTIHPSSTPTRTATRMTAWVLFAPHSSFYSCPCSMPHTYHSSTTIHLSFSETEGDPRSATSRRFDPLPSSTLSTEMCEIVFTNKLAFLMLVSQTLSFTLPAFAKTVQHASAHNCNIPLSSNACVPPAHIWVS